MAGRIKTATFLRDFNEDEKAAPQMKGIVDSVIEEHGTGTPLTVEQITSAMEGNIQTRQPLARIFGYYAPKLEELGIIEVDRSAPAKKSKDDSAEDEDVSGELSDEDEEESEEV